MSLILEQDGGNEELKHRFFVGGGHFVKEDQSKNLRLIYEVSEVQAGHNA